MLQEKFYKGSFITRENALKESCYKRGVTRGCYKRVCITREVLQRKFYYKRECFKRELLQERFYKRGRTRVVLQERVYYKQGCVTREVLQERVYFNSSNSPDDGGPSTADIPV
jgi:hypothetical protein